MTLTAGYGTPRRAFPTEPCEARKKKMTTDPVVEIRNLSFGYPPDPGREPVWKTFRWRSGRGISWA